MDYDKAYVIAKHLSSSRSFSKSFDIYLNQVVLCLIWISLPISGMSLISLIFLILTKDLTPFSTLQFFLLFESFFFV